MTKHDVVRQVNEEISAFMQGSRPRPLALQQCLRFLYESKKLGAVVRRQNNVEWCYFRKLFGHCHRSGWSLEDTFQSMQASRENAALYTRLKEAVKRSGVEFESATERVMANRLMNSKPNDFVARKRRAKKRDMKSILTFSYFPEGFTVKGVFMRVDELVRRGAGTEVYDLACGVCFAAFTFIFPLRPTTTGAITVESVSELEFDEANGVCYIEIESSKTAMVKVRAFPFWLGVLLKVVGQYRPTSSSSLLFIRPDGIPYKERNLRNYIMRRWRASASDLVYIGGNSRRKALETALYNDAYDRPGTLNIVEHSRRVGEMYLLNDSASALAGLRSYVRGYQSLCASHRVQPPDEFIEMISEIKTV